MSGARGNILFGGLTWKHKELIRMTIENYWRVYPFARNTSIGIENTSSAPSSSPADSLGGYAHWMLHDHTDVASLLGPLHVWQQVTAVELESSQRFPADRDKNLKKIAGNYFAGVIRAQYTLGSNPFALTSDSNTTASTHIIATSGTAARRHSQKKHSSSTPKIQSPFWSRESAIRH